jgi:hypothetical protein
VTLIFVAAVLSLLKILNGNLLAASRLLFALGQRGLVRQDFVRIHQQKRPPERSYVWDYLRRQQHWSGRPSWFL